MRLKRNWRHNLGLLAVVVALALVLGDYGRDFIAVDRCLVYCGQHYLNLTAPLELEKMLPVCKIVFG